MSVRAAVPTALLAVAVFVSGCGDSSGDESTAGETTQPAVTSVATTAAKSPQPGGSVTIGQFSPLGGFDPVNSLGGSGTVGGVELTAIYDTILARDTNTGAYVPRTAESMTPSSDFLTWTLKLKSGIKFTDGTSYDAAAVKLNVERHTAPTSRSSSRAILASSVKSIAVTDALTLTFTLNQPWAGFPALFARDVGMIASPAAIVAGGDSFHSKPAKAGAGPFVVETFTPGESLVLVRNESYYGAKPYLDKVTFVPMTDAQRGFDGMVTGGIQATFMRTPDIIAKARENKDLTVLAERIPGGNIIDINAGVEVTCTGGAPAVHCAGKPDGTKVRTTTPGSDVRIRRAIGAAVDPSAVNERAYSGKANAGTQLFSKDFPLTPNVAGPKYDPELAKRLVNEAKAAGWDGSIRIYSIKDSAGQALGLTVSTMLQAAGMTTQLNSDFDPPSMIRKVITDRDYDLVIWGAGFGENFDGNYLTALRTFSTAGAATRSGYSSATMDAAVGAMRTAATDTARTAAYGKFAEVLADEVPSLPLLELENAFVTSKSLQGVTRGDNSTFLLDKAWLDR